LGSRKKRGKRNRKPKRKLTPAEKRARRERRRKYMTIFIHGKQKRVPRPQLIDGMPVEEFIARNADPIWLHENGLWELMPSELHQGTVELELDYPQTDPGPENGWPPEFYLD
jgi:hypothetical protein